MIFQQILQVPISQHLRSGQHRNTTMTELEVLCLEAHELAFLFFSCDVQFLASELTSTTVKP
jgi:hypothetical protein